MNTEPSRPLFAPIDIRSGLNSEPGIAHAADWLQDGLSLAQGLPPGLRVVLADIARTLSPGLERFARYGFDEAQAHRVVIEADGSIVLRGHGTVNHAVTVSGGGMLAPGNAGIGTLVVPDTAVTVEHDGLAKMIYLNVFVRRYTGFTFQR